MTRRWSEAVHAARLACCLLAAGLTLGCEPPRDAAGPPARSATRDTLDILTPLASIGGEDADSLVLMPVNFGVGADVVYLFDRGDYRVKAFDAATGVLRWAFGRAGSGPGELRNPWHFAPVRGGGSVWVTDPALLRATLISERGEFLDDRPMRAGDIAWGRLLLLERHSVATMMPDAGFAIELAGDGAAARGIDYPVPELEDAAPVHRQAFVGVADEGDTWAASFPFFDLFAIYEGATLRCTGRARSGVPVSAQAELAADAPVSTWGVALVGPYAVLLARDDGDGVMRVLDVFRAEDCGYVGSVFFPDRLRLFAGSGTVVAAVVEDPVPRIVTWRLAVE